MSAEIIIGADIVPTVSNMSVFECGDINRIIDSGLLKILSSAEYRIFNLEVPLTNIEKPIKKFGPNLIASEDCIKGIKKLDVNFMTLANNHIMDQGEQGLLSTMQILNDNGIAHAGAGENVEKAAEPYEIEISGKRIGIYCCAEHEFSIAGDHTPGANPFNPLISLDHISDLKRRCDYVICLYHGGKEHYRYPSPNLQKTCRRIAEKGADLVVCQHSHCVGCEEKWEDSTIIYGQGNFLFDHSDSPYWKTALLISIKFNNEPEINYIPIVKEGNGVRLGEDDILKDFEQRSLQIQKNGFVENEYKKLASEQIERYLTDSDFLCSTFIFKGINKIFRDHLRKFVTKRKLKKSRERLIDQYSCEAHRELILKGLEVNKINYKHKFF